LLLLVAVAVAVDHSVKVAVVVRAVYASHQ
jgi:hypothetical protein